MIHPARRLALVAGLAAAALAIPAGGCESAGNDAMTGTGFSETGRVLYAPEPRVAPPSFGTRDAWARRGDPSMGRFDRVASPDPSDRAQMRATSIRVLERAAASNSPLLRANAIEALSGEPDRVLPIVRLGLGDPNRGVRFTATMMVGRLQMRPLMSLVEPLLADESASVRGAAIYALTRCGRKVDPTPLAGMLLQGTREERGNAALILGRLGNRSAADMLRSAYGSESPTTSRNSVRSVELQIAEAAFRLDRDVKDLELIRAALFSGEGEEELAAFAAQILGELRDEGSLRTLVYIATRDDRPAPAEVRMAAATAVARIRPDGAPSAPLMAYVGSANPALRAQAAAGLGWFREASVLSTLATLLEDRNAIVQVAAASSILRATEPGVLARPAP